MSRDEWLKWRRTGIGASEIAGVLGISPWSSPWAIWADKVGLLPPAPMNEHMEAGRWIEAAIGPWFADRTGLLVAGEQTECTHRTHRTHLATVDGVVFDDLDTADRFTADDWVSALGLLEIKVLGDGRRWEEIPAHYRAQGQWQMHVTGLDKVWFAVLMGRRLDIHEMERDQAWIDMAAEAADKLWTDHIVTGDMPPTDGTQATTDALAAVYAAGNVAPASVVDVAPGWLGKLGDLAAVKETQKAAAAIRDDIENEIKVEMGDHEMMAVDGDIVASLRPQTRRTTCKHCGEVTETRPYKVLRIRKEYQ